MISTKEQMADLIRGFGDDTELVLIAITPQDMDFPAIGFEATRDGKFVKDAVAFANQTLSGPMNKAAK